MDSSILIVGQDDGLLSPVVGKFAGSILTFEKLLRPIVGRHIFVEFHETDQKAACC